MQKKLFNEIGLLLLRVVPSVLMITHGYPKFQNLISGDIKFGDPIGGCTCCHNNGGCHFYSAWS